MKTEISGSDHPDEVLRKLLVEGWLGNLFESHQFEGTRPWTFDPLAICSLAIANKGMLPSVKVALHHVQDEFIANSMGELNFLFSRFRPLLDSIDAEERQYAVTCLHEIAEKTICTHTDFNEKGNGSPLLCSSTPIIASAGKKGAQYAELRNSCWNGLDELANMTFKHVFFRLSSRDHSKNAVDLLILFCTHMFERNGVSNDDAVASDSTQNNMSAPESEDDDTVDTAVLTFDMEDSDDESEKSELPDEFSDNGGSDDDNSCAASLPGIEDFPDDEDDVGPIPGLG
mmetsp:Transcript_34491/g.101375  ORF Transcript_34491/g.101375 Transcript_34491/m.101375 type:complete len:286 (+) Transcript_34491:354-1211(+)